MVHYCVANMPGAVPNTSTHALYYATLPCGLAPADKAVADDLGYPCVDPATALGG